LPRGTAGRPMDEAEYAAWEAQAVESYAQSWIERGTPPEQARAMSETSHRNLLPGGSATPGTALHVLVHDGTTVGHVWVASREVRAGRSGSYVYDVAVKADLRGKGYGRALMLHAERIALEAGSELLGLHVFAGNTPALRLYESLGYVTTRRNFFKPLL
uniref:GNAT family N-acetyltransferase n=1 Tax=Streptomyces lushanensis TaxID=1434255 RepID=UPI00114D219A